MRTQVPELRRIALTAVFALLCAAMLIAGWISFGGDVPLKPRGYRVSMHFDEARSLNPGADVQVAGVDIGRVVEVDSTRSGDAAVTVELQSRFVPLREGTIAKVRSKTLLGESYVELRFGTDGDAIPDGGRLPQAGVRESQGFDEFLSTFSPQTRAHLRGTLAGVAAAFDTRADEFSDSVGAFAPTSANVREVLEILDGQRPQLQRLLSSSADVLGAVGERDGSVQASLRAGNQFLAATARRNAELAATVRAFPPFLRELRAVSEELDAASGDLNASMTALRGVAPGVAPALRAISGSTPAFEDVFERLQPTLRAATERLPLVERIADAAPPMLRELYPASRELIPVIALVAADRLDAIGIIANISNVTHGVGVGPGNLILPYGTGLPTIWNEVIGGYKKKLPTNRPNPYPKPGALELAPEGFLRSFQCRHTGNPLIIPPTGTGTPPCVEQGPWEFRGQSAYYPRLKRASP